MLVLEKGPRVGKLEPPRGIASYKSYLGIAIRETRGGEETIVST
jgi:hypothetical protein